MAPCVPLMAPCVPLMTPCVPLSATGCACVQVLSRWLSEAEDPTDIFDGPVCCAWGNTWHDLFRCECTAVEDDERRDTVVQQQPCAVAAVLDVGIRLVTTCQVNSAREEASVDPNVAVHPDALTLELGERYLLESRLDQRQERLDTHFLVLRRECRAILCTREKSLCYRYRIKKLTWTDAS